ncbi:MAG: DNRLRE domain-containing protein [Candidatus Krumholzibacteria bacterium]
MNSKSRTRRSSPQPKANDSRRARLAILIAGTAWLLGCSHADPLQPPPPPRPSPPPQGDSTAVLTAAKDNTLYETALGELSNGAGEYFFVGRTGSGRLRRGLIGFDIAAGLPSGATVTSVSLTFHMSRTIVGPESIAVHNVLAEWGESTSNSNVLGGGGGAPSAPGDATWIHTFFDTSLWVSPGGDFSTASSAAEPVDTVGFYNWSTPQMAADVQAWLDDPSKNFGWILIGPENMTSTKRFDTRENTTGMFRPRLTVRYKPAP